MCERMRYPMLLVGGEMVWFVGYVQTMIEEVFGEAHSAVGFLCSERMCQFQNSDGRLHGDGEL